MGGGGGGGGGWVGGAGGGGGVWGGGGRGGASCACRIPRIKPDRAQPRRCARRGSLDGSDQPRLAGRTEKSARAPAKRSLRRVTRARWPCAGPHQKKKERGAERFAGRRCPRGPMFPRRVLRRAERPPNARRGGQHAIAGAPACETPRSGSKFAPRTVCPLVVARESGLLASESRACSSPAGPVRASMSKSRRTARCCASRSPTSPATGASPRRTRAGPVDIARVELRRPRRPKLLVEPPSAYPPVARRASDVARAAARSRPLRFKQSARTSCERRRSEAAHAP